MLNIKGTQDHKLKKAIRGYYGLIKSLLDR